MDRLYGGEISPAPKAGLYDVTSGEELAKYAPPSCFIVFLSAGVFVQHVVLKASFFTSFKANCLVAVAKLQLNSSVLAVSRRTPLWTQHQPPFVQERRRTESDFHLVSQRGEREKRAELLTC